MNAFLIVALLSLATGCSTIYEGKFDSDDGWRVGKVIATGTDNTLFKTAGLDCRREQLSDATRITNQFAYVQFEFHALFGKYFYGGAKRRHAIVFIPANESYRNGEAVYVNIRNCKMPLVHISRAS